MPRVLITPRAEADLLGVHSWIATEGANPEAAEAFVRALHEKFESYAHQPEMGEPRNDLSTGLRSFPFKRNDVVVYQPLPDGIEVVRLFHGARDYPTLFGEE